MEQLQHHFDEMANIISFLTFIFVASLLMSGYGFPVKKTLLLKTKLKKAVIAAKALPKPTPAPYPIPVHVPIYHHEKHFKPVFQRQEIKEPVYIYKEVLHRKEVPVPYPVLVKKPYLVPVVIRIPKPYIVHVPSPYVVGESVPKANKPPGSYA